MTLGENKWDLRSRHTFDKVHIDMKDVYSDMDTSDSDSEEADEEEEYNKTFGEPVEEERSDFGQDEDEDDLLPPSEEDAEKEKKNDFPASGFQACKSKAVSTGSTEVYQPWSKEEDDRLLLEQREGKTIPEMSEIHKRTQGAIRSRLKKLERI